MDSVASILAVIVSFVFGLIALFALMKLFTINETLKEIRNELLIARQERQVANMDAGTRHLRSSS